MLSASQYFQYFDSFYMLAASMQFGTSKTTEPTGDVSTGRVQPNWRATTSLWPLEDCITMKRRWNHSSVAWWKGAEMKQHQIPEIGGRRNLECDDSVEDIIRNTPTFQACKSSINRNRSTTTPKWHPRKTSTSWDLGPAHRLVIVFICVMVKMRIGILSSSLRQMQTWTTFVPHTQCLVMGHFIPAPNILPSCTHCMPEWMELCFPLC